MKYLSDYDNTIEYARKEAFGQGVMQTARNMLNEGLKPRTVARCTKLPLEQIMALR